MLIAVVDRVLGRGLAFLPRVAPEHGLSDFQRTAAPLLANLLLLAAALQAVLLLPGLILARRARLERLVFGALALGTLAMLGLVIWRRAANTNVLIAFESALLVLGLGLVALRLALRSGLEGVDRAVAAGFFLSLALPSTWRFGIALAGGRFETGDPLDRLREAADLAGLIALGLTVLPPLLRRQGRALLCATPAVAGLLWLGRERYGDLRQVIADGTNLWLASLAPIATLGLLALGTFGLIAWPLGAWWRRRGFGIALAVFLAASAGFMPTENETFLLAWTATLIAARTANGEIDRGRMAALYD